MVIQEFDERGTWVVAATDIGGALGRKWGPSDPKVGSSVSLREA